MFPRLVRAVLFGATALALWLVAVPAFAAESAESEADARAARAAANAAPMCDDRGATRLAPPPSLVADGPSLEVGPAPASCNGSITAGEQATPSDGDPSQNVPNGSEWLATFPSTHARVLIPDSTLALRRDDQLVPSAGVRARVERPPRG
jgi:hypothetical protein